MQRLFFLVLVQEESYTSVNGEEVELFDSKPIKRVLEKQKDIPAF